MEDSIFSIQAEDIDSEKIMKQIRQNIAERKIDNDLWAVFGSTPSLADSGEDVQFNMNLLMDSIKYCRMNWDIEPESTILSNRKVLGRLVILIKRVVGKLIKWYIDPIIYQQIDFNNKTATSMQQMASYIRLTEKKIAAYEKRIRELLAEKEGREGDKNG